MARPRSEDKRNAIMSATVRMIVAHGLGAPTAMIAREAMVSNGSLFTYFDTKAALFNQLYVELKQEMASASLAGLAGMADVANRGDLREQVFQVWSNWTSWAVTHPDKRRALAQLVLSEDLTPASRTAGQQAMAGIAGLMQRSRALGAMRDAPMAFVVAIMNSVAEATMDFMMQDKANADRHCRTGFDALWRAIA